MEETKAMLDGAWADLPAETWAFAVGLSRGGDLERRIAMLLVDNSVELALRTYLELPVRVRGGEAVKWDRDPTFWHLIKGYEQCLSEWPVGIQRDSLEWLHGIRNRVHHDGNGVGPRSKDLDAYVQVGRILIDHLFGPRATEVALLEQSLSTSVAADDLPSDSRPTLVRELDELIEGIRTLMAELPLGAPPSLAVPAGTLDTARRAEETISEIGMDWSSELQESSTDYMDWIFEIDELPDTPEQTIEVLQRLRYLLRLALS